MPKRKLQDALQSEEASQETTERTPSALTSQTGKQEEAGKNETAKDSLTTPEKSREILLKPTDKNGTDNPSTSNASATNEATTSNPHNEPKRKKSVRWSDVTVYLFPRQQGFTCVPSTGGVTLGMKREHSEVRSVTLTEHEQECRSRRIQYIQQQQQHQTVLDTQHSDEEVEEEEEDEEVSEEVSEEEEVEGEESEEELEEEYDDGISFPVSVSIRQRRSLLKEAGCQVDNNERQDCQFIRVSREACGCQCQTVCNPDECSCSLNKIKCQVDRYSYPCGCTKEGCGNETGRVEFNPARVKTHYLNTVSRMASSSSTTSSDCSIATEQITNQGTTTTTNGHYTQQSYSVPGLGYEAQNGMHYGSDTYGQLPSAQCEYSMERSSVTTTGSYHMQSTNMSMSVESFSTSSTVCQPNYHYYNMHQPSYPEHDLSLVPEIATNGPVNGCMPYGYPCAYPEEAYSHHMISPPHEYSQHNGDYASPVVALPYPQLASDGHYSDSSPSSEASSRDSSVSDRTHDVEDLDFGELIKQSLVDTALA